MTAFEEMGVLREIAKATEDLGWSLPTDVQAEAIPLILGGGDVLMAAETGSGKTGAFCLPILQIVWETLKDIESGKGLNTSTEISNKSSLSSPWGLSLYDRGRSMAVTPNGLRCQSREQREWHGCRANKGIQGPGKYYYEATVTDEGLCRVGWSTSQASLDLGTDKYSFGYGGTGKKSNSKKFDDYGTSFGIHDVIGCLIDFDNGEISFTKNGINLGKAFDLNQQQKKDIYYPAVVLKNAEMSFNFGDEKFKYIPNNGYIGVKLAPDNSIKLNPINSNNQLNKIGKFESSPNAPQAIIIEPSKELATQTYEQINKFGTYIKDPKIKQLLVIGGTSAKEQIDKLNKGVDIVVGTPGRLEDLIQGGYLSLTHCRFFVLDEADGLLKQGYTGLIDRIYKDIPKITPDNKRLQMIVCSATLHDFEVKKMANKLMHYPTWVDLKGEDAVPDTVHHVVAIIDPQIDKSWKNLPRHIQTDGVHYNDNIKYGNNETPETLSEAVKILKGEYCIRAIRQNNMDRALIFCRTKNDCDNLENYLLSIDKNEFSCVSLHADKKQHERKLNLEKFKNKQVKFLICTDVAARGIDINGLPFMINMTLPDEKSNYVHRIGRVGRADRMGLAISLVSNVPEKVWYHGQWCSSRGRNCNNTNLTDHGGCCIWYKEKQTCLADIEEHLLITIQQINSDMKVPVNEFDGKVVYGQKKIIKDNNYNNHVQQLASDVDNLAKLESTAQLAYLQRYQTISY